ncbi:MAG: 50S ribosomal protein L2 [Candidatus Micrarchaeia archaeon]
MGKKLHQQRRGKGSNIYKKLPGTYDITATYANINQSTGEVLGFLNHPGHTGLLMALLYDDFSTSYMIAPEGIKIGDKIYINPKEPKYALGSILKLKDIPEGVPIYNIERHKGDGGAIARAAGAFGTILSHTPTGAVVKLMSKRIVTLDNECRAQLGVSAGSGMHDAPLMKAGKSFYIMHATNKWWPRPRGVKMTPADHPFGGKEHHEGKSSITPRNSPPGRKVGHIAARRIGRKKRG